MANPYALFIVFVLFAFSFLIIQNLPSYIAESADYSIIVHVLWVLGFAIAFIKTALG